MGKVNPRPKKSASTSPGEEAFLEKAEQPQKEEKPVQVHNLRIPTDLLKEVEQLIAYRKPKVSRNQWLLEAIYEKVEREQQKLE